MTPSIAFTLAIVLLIMFIFVMGTISDSVIKILANKKGMDPGKFNIFPSDLKSIIGGTSSRPSYVSDEADLKVLEKGFDINLLGKADPAHGVEEFKSSTYAIKPKDFIGMMPIPKAVPEVGENVKAGDILFFDKKRPEIKYAAPVSGEFVGVKRGAKRSINEFVILADKKIKYRKYDLPELESVSRAELVAFLLESGAWPFIRQRPFDIVADHNQQPKSIFVSTFDTAPLSPGFEHSVAGQGAAFQKGLDVLSKLTDGKVHLALDARGDKAPAAEFTEVEGVEKHWFSGQHPAGNVGVHIHHVDPVNNGEVVWHVDVYGVLLLGTLFEKGIFDTSRVIALCGYEVEKPRLLKVHQGVCVEKLVENINFEKEVDVLDAEGNEIKQNAKAVRLVSGDPLTGKEITNTGYLGFFDDQITTIEEGDYYELFGWLIPRVGHPTQNRTFVGGFAPSAQYKADTQQNGEHRAFVVSGEYESVLPMDIYPQYLLRAIMANDFEKMEGLGILELGEEDLALCEYVCTSKHPVQKTLREGLNALMEQG